VHVYLSGAFGSAKAVGYSAETPETRTTTRQPVSIVMMGIIFDVQPVPPRAPAQRSIPPVPQTALPR
ncbi:hypothetical protein, partial [Longimicrobium sp.]|uniref:hypothetical protein n=1 Tax=Longimicrobium sp. TaxID=2029185 RepID=UPI002F930FC4